jgi:aldose 1-epimerase
VSLISLAAGASRAVVAPALGGAIVSWHRRERPILRPPLAGALDSGFVRGLASFPLVPYSNRIVRGRFAFAGTAYAIPATFGRHAIHGVGWQAAWTVAAQTAHEVTLTLHHRPDAFWPFAFDAEMRIGLADAELAVQLAATNRHAAAAPFGLGIHPYFPRGAGATLAFTAAGVWQNAPDMAPVSHVPIPPAWDRRTPQPLGSHELDNCFTGWRGPARIAYPAAGHAIAITADDLFANLVVYDAAVNDFIAVEPVSNANDAINRPDLPLSQAMRVLAPGETLAGTMRLAVEDTAA